MPYTTRVMLVDEDHDLLSMLQDYLKRKRVAQVDIACESLMALNAHLDHPCDVVVLSMTMDDMHYSRFVDHLTAVGCPRVILLAPAIEGPQILKALRLGVADVLAKPFDLPELWESVKRLLDLRLREVRLRRKRRQLRENLHLAHVENRMLQSRVDLLSKDLVGAYRRLAKRVTDRRC